jgi:hypothetical protein
VGYALNHTSFGAFAGQKAGGAAKPGLLYRFYKSLMQARQRQADRIVVRYLEESNHVLTDEAEREMMRRVTAGNGWTSYR